MNANPFIPTEAKESAIALVEGREMPSAERGKPPDRIIGRKEVAKLIGKTEKTVDYYGRLGVFRRVRLGRSSRATGYSFASVMNWLEEKEA
jgi:predicted DNA-binding transcriptional regulator AlpA